MEAELLKIGMTKIERDQPAYSSHSRLDRFGRKTMLYVTGDTHGHVERFKDKTLLDDSTWVSEDKLIICGDFGFVFAADHNQSFQHQQEQELDFLEQKPYSILFIDGNHENHDYLDSLPVEERYAGNVHRIRNNIFHLMRGQVFNIDGITIFTMGGAYSIDKSYRTEGISWWSRELPSPSEYKEAAANLKRTGNQADYIISHTAPQNLIRLMGYQPDPHDMELTGFLDWIWHDIKFKHWYFGHWHQDQKIHPKATACWFNVHTLE